MTVARPMVLEDFFKINAPVIHTPTLEEAVELCRAVNYPHLSRSFEVGACN